MPNPPAPVLRPAETRYSGRVTTPGRWERMVPRRGDVIVCTPAKAGTTWTQAIVAMLLHGTTEFPDRLTHISPWVDAAFQPEDEMHARLEAQTGRRVFKTHTPADGFPVWDGVTFIAVFRHPLEILLSIRKHIANMTSTDDTHAMVQPMDAALAFFMDHDPGTDDIDSDCIMSTVLHYRAATSGRWPDPVLLNYADLSRDRAGVVRLLDARLGTGRDPALLDAITDATAFGAMKSKATEFVPESGSGLWHDENRFFAKGASGTWREAFTPGQIAAFEATFARHIPDDKARRWILEGG